MPELPEVETTCRGIAPYILQQRISAIVVRDHRLRWPIPPDLPQRLVGQTIVHVSRRAKYLLLETDVGTLILHLGMSGSLRVLSVDTPPQRHDHLDIMFDNGQVLRLRDPRRFGCVLFTNYDSDLHPLLADLGIEPLTRGFDGDYLFEHSRGRKVAVKSFIMDSRIVVGVGNIYASEALFLAAIHPKRAAGRITVERYRGLAQTIKQVLRAAIQQGGTSLRDFVNSDGNPGYFRQRLRVYDRAGQACPNCLRPIRHAVIGQRSSYYCSHCQT